MASIEPKYEDAFPSIEEYERDAFLELHRVKNEVRKIGEAYKSGINDIKDMLKGSEFFGRLEPLMEYIKDYKRYVHNSKGFLVTTAFFDALVFTGWQLVRDKITKSAMDSLYTMQGVNAGFGLVALLADALLLSGYIKERTDANKKLEDVRDAMNGLFDRYDIATKEGVKRGIDAVYNTYSAFEKAIPSFK